MDIENLELHSFEDLNELKTYDDDFDDEPFYYKMTIDEWINARNMGIYCNDDGYGFYGTDTEISDIEVFSQLMPPEGMNYVYWYEK